MAKIFEVRGRFTAHYANEAETGFYGARAPGDVPIEGGTTGVFDSAHIQFDNTSGAKFCGWVGGDNWPSTNNLSIRWRIEPNWTGLAPNKNSLLEAQGGDAFRISGADFALLTAGELSIDIYEGDFSTVLAVNPTGLTFTAGQITDIMFTYNGATGAWELGQDGATVTSGTGLALGVNRDNKNVFYLGVGRGANVANPRDYKLYQLEIWDSVESISYTARTAYDSTAVKQPTNWTSITAAQIASGVDQIQSGLTQTGTLVNETWTTITAAEIKSGVNQIQNSVTITGTYVGETWTTITADQILSGVEQIQNGTTVTGTLSVPTAVNGTATTVNIPNLKEQIRFILATNNTTTSSVLDLSSSMSTRVQKVAKLNPEKLPIQPSLYPAVTVYTDRKSLEHRDVLVNQTNGKRRGEVTFKILGIVWNNDYQTDLFNDPADDDIERLMENIERILRSYSSLDGNVKWQIPTDVTYHAATFDEETHMRVGVLDLEATIFY